MTNYTKYSHDEDFDKTIDLLTPKFRQKTTMSFKAKKQRGRRATYWRIAAAITAIIVAGTGLIVNINARTAPSKVIEYALSDMQNAENYKIGFTILGKETHDVDMYEPRPDGKPISGIMYISYSTDDEEIKERIEWHDSVRSTVIFDGKYCILIQREKETGRKKSRSVLEVRKMMNLDSVMERISNDEKTELITTGDKVILRLSSNEQPNYLVATAEFSKRDRKLEKVVMTAITDGNAKNILITDFIEYNNKADESLFNQTR